MGPIQRIAWLRHVANHYKNSAGTISVAIVLAEHANNETGLAWPSLTTIAHLAGLNRSPACRCLQRLIRDGFLKKLEKGGPGNKSTTYRLIHIVTDRSLGVVTERSTGSDRASNEVVTDRSPEPIKNLRRTRARAREEDQAAAPQEGSPGQLKEPRWRHIAQRHWPWYARQLGKDGTLRYLDSFKGKAEAIDRLEAAWRTATEEQRLRVRLEADKDEGVAA